MAGRSAVDVVTFQPIDQMTVATATTASTLKPPTCPCPGAQTARLGNEAQLRRLGSSAKYNTSARAVKGQSFSFQNPTPVSLHPGILPYLLMDGRRSRACGEVGEFQDHLGPKEEA